MSDWMIFQGKPQSSHDGIDRLKDIVPPWRNFKDGIGDQHRGETYIPSSPDEIRLVNAALYLRRPLLVTGAPGCGKSSLAHAIAQELRLGRVLKWPINSRSTLTEGLYQYDAISRLRDVSFQKRKQDENPANVGCPDANSDPDDLSRYLNLQWLGTALASPKPRVVLIDEIDKADIDLPNDLLHILEEGTFTIPELQRIADDREEVTLRTCEPNGETTTVTRGIVPCKTFPIIVITSNEERELPPAFHRRCLRLRIDPPPKEKLEEIVQSHLKNLIADNPAAMGRIEQLIKDYLTLRQEGKVMATDQLLNLVYLLFRGKINSNDADSAVLQQLIFQGLNI